METENVNENISEFVSEFEFFHKAMNAKAGEIENKHTIAAYMILLFDVTLHVLFDYRLISGKLIGLFHFFDHTISAAMFIVGVYLL